MRWLFHVLRAGELRFDAAGRYAPPSLEREGFIHASFRDTVAESARLYFGKTDDLQVLVIDRDRLDVPVEIAQTPRGPMPHIHGSVAREAFSVIALDDVARWDA